MPTRSHIQVPYTTPHDIVLSRAIAHLTLGDYKSQRLLADPMINMTIANCYAAYNTSATPCVVAKVLHNIDWFHHNA